MLPTIIIVGNLTDDPSLHFTPQGFAVSNVRIACQDRRFNDTSREWEDVGDPFFITGSVWRDYAEHVAESLRKGDNVLAVGKLRLRTWETNEGEQRTANELMIDEIGPTLRWRKILHSDGKGNKVTREGAADPRPPWPDAAAETATGPWRADRVPDDEPS